MAIVLEAIEHVWYAGRIIPPGEVFSADDSFAKKLIGGGSAKVNKAVEVTKADNSRKKKVIIDEANI